MQNYGSAATRLTLLTSDLREKRSESTRRRALLATEDTHDRFRLLSHLGSHECIGDESLVWSQERFGLEGIVRIGAVAIVEVIGRCW